MRFPDLRYRSTIDPDHGLPRPLDLTESRRVFMSRAIHRSFLLVLFALVGSFLVATPKPALASGGVISPASGDSVATGFTGPIQIDFSGMSPDTYTVEIYDNNSDYYESSNYTYDGNTGNSTWTADFAPM